MAAASASTSRGSSLPLTQLYGPAHYLEAPGRPWSVEDFKAVDDRVRGGASTSAVHLAAPQGNEADAKAGELVFSGFLDITTLGGAGFASQQCTASPPFPISLSQQRHSGLRLLVRPAKATTTSTALEEGQAPGGGKGPVKSYLLNLYPKLPVKRPDGRNESSVTYEHSFRLDPRISSSNQSDDGQESLLSVDLAWKDFKPFYRGKPAEDAGSLDPSEVKIWSLMARSDFGAQSGPFELQVHSLWAVGKEESSSSGSRGNEVCGRELDSVWEKEEDRWQPADMSGSAGFALYLFATLALVIWTLWALTPDACLRAVGIDWYPSREWAFILPSFSLVLVLFAYIVYLALNLQMTPELNDLRTMTDTHATLLPVKRAGDMTFAQAKAYYEHGHPMRESNISPEEKRRLLSKEMYDLPRKDRESLTGAAKH